MKTFNFFLFFFLNCFHFDHKIYKYFFFFFLFVHNYFPNCVLFLWNLLQTGGPLMYFDRRYSVWIASGIVSFGAEKCGTIGIPGVYTKIENYIEWIVNSLEK